MSREANRRGHGRRLATDDDGICTVENDPTASARQRFYPAYQYFRLEPDEPSTGPFDDAARACAAQRHARDPLPRRRNRDVHPHISLTKEATEADFDAVNDVLHYTIIATNDGNVTLYDVTITDPKLGALTCTRA